MIKKFLQQIFKAVSHFIFFKIYGKIEKPLKGEEDNKIKIEISNIDKNLSYKIYKITDGRLYTDRIHDTAIINDNRIIEGPSFQLRYTSEGKIYNSNINENIVFKKGTPRILKKLNGTTLSLLTGGGGNYNYWHWLFDVLPRLALCNKNMNLKEIDYFLLPSLLKKFQKETLNFLNVPQNKRISSEKFRHIKAKELIVTDHPVLISGNATEDITNIPIWIIQWLKSSFLKKNIINNVKIKKKIYIDRNNANNKNLEPRRISNEEEVKNYLLKNNFILVKLHEIGFNEQVDLFHNADCIVGLNGAGFGNLVFCESGVKVIEFRPSNEGGVIKNLAQKNNLNYHSIIIQNQFGQQGSIHVPINSLTKILES